MKRTEGAGEGLLLQKSHRQKDQKTKPVDHNRNGQGEDEDPGEGTEATNQLS